MLRGVMIKSNEKVRFVCLLALLSVFILSVGLMTDVFLGDEIAHFHFAKMIYEFKELPAYDPLYGGPNDPGNYAIGFEPFWHILLSIIWRLTGGVSTLTAQIYHLSYYILLLSSVFLIGRHIGRNSTGLWSVFLVGTTPMVAVFSILFYLDIPSVAFVTLCIYFILSERAGIAGILLGLSYLTKRNVMFILPSILFLLIYTIGFKERRIWIRKMLIFLGVSFFVILPDFIRRFLQFGSLYQVPSVQYGGVYLDPPVSRYMPSSALNPWDLVSYLGIASILLFFLFLFGRREKKGIFLLAPIVNYLIVFPVFFGYYMHGYDVRYLMPAVPFLCVLGGLALSSFSGRNWFKIVVVFICVLQLLGSGWKIYQNRRPSMDTREAFIFIKENTRPGALILYPEDNLLYWTERRPLWGRFRYLSYLFWRASPEEMKDIFKINKLDYLLIKKSRIYDDSKEGNHTGGYPWSFVSKLGSLPFIRLVFESKEFSLWQLCSF
jgi:4-amino-4-deoxy-L-arabinose transferase-like glycosyltransferase